MMLFKSKVKNNGEPLSIRNVYSVTEFHGIISYERSRCDRENKSFSVILINLDKKNGESYSNIPKYIKGLKKTLRGIDHIGWWEEGTLAVLLPSTPKDGAMVCASKVKNYMSSEKAICTINVFCYPDHWLEEKTCDESEDRVSCEQNSITFEKVFSAKIPNWKRVVDIAGSLAGLVVLSPVFFFTTLFIKAASPGKAFFVQKRVGYRGAEFDFYKFRTMKEGNNQAFHGKYATCFIQDADTPMVKLDDVDPRIIPGGKILRKLCIDELPQLLNVLKGDMSLVGPRPCIPYEKESYLQWHTHRFDIVPGMTGLWQVSGKNKLTFKQMIRLDIAYCRNVSLWLDLKIILLTPLAIIKIMIDSVSSKLSNGPDSDSGVSSLRKQNQYG